MDSWFFLPFSRYVDSAITGPEEAKNPAGLSPPPDSDPFSDAEVWKKSAGLARQIASPLQREWIVNRLAKLLWIV
jgi:hypothetical protein